MNAAKGSCNVVRSQLKARGTLGLTKEVLFHPQHERLIKRRRQISANRPLCTTQNATMGREDDKDKCEVIFELLDSIIESNLEEV